MISVAADAQGGGPAALRDSSGGQHLDRLRHGGAAGDSATALNDHERNRGQHGDDKANHSDEAGADDSARSGRAEGRQDRADTARRACGGAESEYAEARSPPAWLAWFTIGSEGVVVGHEWKLDVRVDSMVKRLCSIPSCLQLRRLSLRTRRAVMLE